MADTPWQGRPVTQQISHSDVVCGAACLQAKESWWFIRSLQPLSGPCLRTNLGMPRSPILRLPVLLGCSHSIQFTCGCESPTLMKRLLKSHPKPRPYASAAKQSPLNFGVRMVGAAGFELATLCSQSRCATRLRYAPTAQSSRAKRSQEGAVARTRRGKRRTRKNYRTASVCHGPKTERSAAGGRARTATGEVAERDAALAQVVRRQLQRHLVAREDADVVLAHLARGVRDQLVAVVERDAVARIRQHLVHHPLHLDQFFFGHVVGP
eukprot:gene13820-18535_t